MARSPNGHPDAVAVKFLVRRVPAGPGFGVADELRILLMHRAYFFIVTAVGEAGTGLALLVLPSLPLKLLLGVSENAPVVLLVARLAGAALLAIGVASWPARRAEESSAQAGLLVGLLIYDGAAAALLAYAGLVLRLAGIALWPAVVIHAVLAMWCGLCLWVEPHRPN